MAKGLFDDVPMLNTERDQAWKKFIKRKDVKAMMKGKEDFKFPLDGSYELWCIAWAKAWDAGFQLWRDNKLNVVSQVYENPEFVFVKEDKAPWIKIDEVAGLSLVARWIRNEYIHTEKSNADHK